jgi:hypothetical protein
VRLFEKRFDELSAQIKQVEASETQKHSEYTGRYREVDDELLLNWSVKAKSLISSACGKDSEHYVAFVKAEEAQSYEDNVARLRRIKAVFMAAMEDFNGGYLNTVRNLIQAELASDEIDQAKELLTAGYFAAAAVVGGVVLETTLRTLCARRGISTASIDRMNADLAKSGEYNTLVQKRITALAAVRNSAAHGKIAEYESDDVKNLISEVERFVGGVLS